MVSIIAIWILIESVFYEAFKNTRIISKYSGCLPWSLIKSKTYLKILICGFKHKSTFLKYNYYKNSTYPMLILTGLSNKVEYILKIEF